MKKLSAKDRSQVTAILIQLIADLAEGEDFMEPEVADTIHRVIRICCRSKLESLPDGGRSLFAEAVGLVDQRDWLFTVLKEGTHFHLEAKFGTDIRHARLAKTITGVEARVN